MRRFLASEAIQARPVGLVGRGWRWCKRNPIVAGLSAAVAVTLIAGTVVSTIFGLEADSRAKSEAVARQAAVDSERREKDSRREAVDKGEDLRRRLSLQYVANGAAALDDADFSVPVVVRQGAEAG